METSIEYLKKNGLKKLLDDFIDQTDKSQKAMYNVEDLHYLHSTIRQRKPFTTLEFGVGFSTIVITHALMLNKLEFDLLVNKPEVRNNNKFRHFVVDSNAYWLENTKDNFPTALLPFVEFNFSNVSITTCGDFQVCSLYENLPDVVADFIYLDGPDPKDVTGSVNGLTFKCNERTVMSGDLLLLESTFLPGTFILVDGRTNNVRFLQNNFRRRYDFNWDKIGDRSTFELIEERLGKHNILGSDFY